ncbi:methylated-DNA--[protein]-cysteine S-methyltransferase [Acetobacterium sp.]|uniref:methylated-DNA--[protein]-cysteine S-methyltransferase n=1 Tax=Acetobacterium sp. TaxID=1872094 RepID=UPI002F40F67E
MEKSLERVWYYDTEIGRVGIAENGNAITEITLLKTCLGPGITRLLDPEIKEETPLSPVGAGITRPIKEETQLLKTAAEQLKEYLAGNRQTFDLPLDPRGTEFQKSVWNALLDIPFGEIRSYKQVAEAIGNPKACRAVGMANNKNPILIVIPCHRVIGSNGSLVGYGGGIDLKENLLKLEGFEVKKKD